MCAAPLPDRIGQGIPPAPSAARPWLPPLVVGAGLSVACLAVAFSDGDVSILPPCPFRAMTGLDCPGCGMSRAARALLRGHLDSALSYNVLLVVAVPFITYLYLRWAASTVGIELPAIRLGSRAGTALVGLLAVFAVVRNLPIGIGRYLNSAT